MATKNQQVLEARSEQKAATKAELFAKKPRTAKAALILDDEAVLEHDGILEELKDARESGAGDNEIAALKDRLADCKARVDEVTRWITFRSIGGEAYDDLVDEHPPSDEQLAEHRDKVKFAVANKVSPPGEPPYNSKTLAPVLVAASMSDPEMTLDEVLEWWPTLNTGERLTLFIAALDVNSRAQRVSDLGKGSG